MYIHVCTFFVSPLKPEAAGNCLKPSFGKLESSSAPSSVNQTDIKNRRFMIINIPFGKQDLMSVKDLLFSLFSNRGSNNLGKISGGFPETFCSRRHFCQELMQMETEEMAVLIFCDLLKGFGSNAFNISSPG